MILVTQPQISFENSTDKILQGIRSLEIDDCDVPLAPLVKVTKVTFQTITIEFSMPRLAKQKPVLEFVVELG